MEGTLEFQLENPIEVHSDGQVIKETFVTLFAPSFENRSLCRKIKQLFFRAATQHASKSQGTDKNDLEVEDDAPGEKMAPSDYLNAMYGSEQSIDEIMATFEKLLISGVCKVGGSIELTTPLLRQIGFQDIEKLFGEYTSRFLVQL